MIMVTSNNKLTFTNISQVSGKEFWKPQELKSDLNLLDYYPDTQD